MDNKLNFNSPVERKAFWQGHVNKWRASGLSQETYCRQHGLKKSPLSYWKLKLEPEQQKRAPASKFVEVTGPNAPAKPLMALKINADGSVSIQIELKAAVLSRLFNVS